MTGTLYRATAADCEAMAGIHAASFSGKDAWSRDVFSLQLALPNVLGLLHRSGGMILLRMAADEAEILTLAVLPDARRRGIGGELLRVANDKAAALGARVIFLEVSVDNVAAHRLYIAAGFVKVGYRANYYPDASDALVLRRDLGETTHHGR